MKALVIDDSRAYRGFVRSMLESGGFEVVEAESCSEALACLKEHGPIHVALVDWNMPGMDGLELIRTIRRTTPASDLRLMMVTTELEMDRVSTALQAGADEYLMKPFTKEALTDKLTLIGIAAVPRDK